MRFANAKVFINQAHVPTEGSEEPVSRAEVEARAKKLKNGKAANKDEGGLMIDWVWKLCNMSFESAVVPED